MLQPFAVGTIDQALMGVLPVKHSFLRLFGLAGKVVVLDEVHSYDLYTGTLLDALITRLTRLGAGVIVLSATLTRKRREQLLTAAYNNDNEEIEEADDAQEATTLDEKIDPYPLLTVKYSTDEIVRKELAAEPDRTIYLSHAPRDLQTVAQNAVRRAEKGELVLCVMNTVDRAQDLYKKICSEIKEGFPTERIGLLHSRFPLAKREELETKRLGIYGKNGDRTQGAILVATQIVEQSVDIDADFLISDLAPTDMLLQRLGRLWRHKRDQRAASRPEMLILYPPDGNEPFEKRLGADAWVYAPYILARSAEEWKKRDKIFIPSEIREILEATYRKRNETGELREMLEKMTPKMEKMSQRAAAMTQNALPSVEKGDCLTRYNDSPSCEILLLREMKNLGDKIKITLLSGDVPKLVPGKRIVETAIALQKNSLNIRKNKRQGIEIAKAPVYNLLYEYYFSEIHPLIVDLETGRLKTLDGVETNCGYRDDLGLFYIEDAPKNRNVNHSYDDGEEKDDYGAPEDFEW